MKNNIKLENYRYKSTSEGINVTPTKVVYTTQLAYNHFLLIWKFNCLTKNQQQQHTEKEILQALILISCNYVTNLVNHLRPK